MAPKFAALVQEFAEFDPELAPGLADFEAFPIDDEEYEAMPAPPLPVAFETTVPANSKPATLSEAFISLGFPEGLQESFLNLVGANASDDPLVVAALPFDVFREGVANDLVLEDGRKPSVFEQGRFHKLFKEVANNCHCVAPNSSWQRRSFVFGLFFFAAYRCSDGRRQRQAPTEGLRGPDPS